MLRAFSYVSNAMLTFPADMMHTTVAVVVVLAALTSAANVRPFLAVSAGSNSNPMPSGRPDAGLLGPRRIRSAYRLPEDGGSGAFFE